jgi:hypothetical protein
MDEFILIPNQQTYSANKCVNKNYYKVKSSKKNCTFKTTINKLALFFLSIRNNIKLYYLKNILYIYNKKINIA